ncbi:MAG: hypothetical protein PHO63_01085 [Bacilli bacterium]|nr:hypothetical protein [Bacilli bacterium]MDD4808510.1 hypothetical protein [Bacilli bacterium]
MVPKEIFELFNEIEYGWVDKDNKKHIVDYDTFFDKYKLQSPDELQESRIGVCWDQVELERYYFNNSGIDVKTYYMVYYDNAKCPTHTFLTYKLDHKVYWFEHSWDRHKGIHEYNNLKELLVDVRKKFIVDQLSEDICYDNLYIYEYTKPRYGMSVEEYCKHCESGSEVKND